MARAEQPSPSDISRRVFIIRAAQIIAVGTEATVLVGQGPRIREYLPPSHSTIKFESDQEKRLQNADSLCLMFGGATIRSIKPTADVLTDALQPLGPVGYVEYAKDSLDVASIAKDVRALQKKYPKITNLSIYAHSLGAQVAGELMDLIGDEIALSHAFLDCAAPSFAYTDHPKIAEGFRYVSALTGEITTVGMNMLAHRRPHKWDLAPTGLLQDEMEELRDGERHIASLARAAASDTSRVILLTPRDPEKDPIVNARASEMRLRQIFPRLEVVYLDGNQGHANPPANPEAYRRAIQNALTSHNRE